MKLPSLKIGHLETPYPVIQAGMGVRIGSATLAAETIRLGGYGTIASVGMGDIEEGKHHFVDVCSNALADEIRKAKQLAGGKKPELRARLEGRGTDAPDVIERRLANAEGEMARAGEYMFQVTNDDLQLAYRRLCDIIDVKSGRL